MHLDICSLCCNLQFCSPLEILPIYKPRTFILNFQHILRSPPPSGLWHFPFFHHWIYSGFIIVYNLADEASFVAAEEILKEIISVKKDKKTPILLLGNKSDLEGERQVLRTSGEKTFRLILLFFRWFDQRLYYIERDVIYKLRSHPCTFYALRY